jgi:hypothetical protein
MRVGVREDEEVEGIDDAGTSKSTRQGSCLHWASKRRVMFVVAVATDWRCSKGIVPFDSSSQKWCAMERVGGWGRNQNTSFRGDDDDHNIGQERQQLVRLRGEAQIAINIILLISTYWRRIPAAC